jgi:hypothetical protein
MKPLSIISISSMSNNLSMPMQILSCPFPWTWETDKNMKSKLVPYSMQIGSSISMLGPPARSKEEVTVQRRHQQECYCGRQRPARCNALLLQSAQLASVLLAHPTSDGGRTSQNPNLQNSKSSENRIICVSIHYNKPSYLRKHLCATGCIKYIKCTRWRT